MFFMCVRSLSQHLAKEQILYKSYVCDIYNKIVYMCTQFVTSWLKITHYNVHMYGFYNFYSVHGVRVLLPLTYVNQINDCIY